MDLHLRDKHILITGCNKGIDPACAQVFLQEGARVTRVSRQALHLHEHGRGADTDRGVTD